MEKESTILLTTGEAIYKNIKQRSWNQPNSLIFKSSLLAMCHIISCKSSINCIYSCLQFFLMFSCRHISIVQLRSSFIAPVCSQKQRLELMCTPIGRFWVLYLSKENRMKNISLADFCVLFPNK